MSRVLAIVTAFLTISHSCVNAQPGLPGTCLPGFNWSFNSLGQSPCVIATALADICPTSSGYTYGPLLPGWHWYGPSQSNNNSCLCSTVLYSVMCACAYCQNGGCLDWSVYDASCTSVYIQVFLDPIGSSIVVPHYVYLDVVTDDFFNITAAMSAGGPDSTLAPGPTSIISTIPSQSASASPTSSTPAPISVNSIPTSTSVFYSPTSGASSSTSTSTSVTVTTKNLNVAAIVGGVLGGIIFAGLALTFLRRRKRVPPITSTATRTLMINEPGSG